MYIYNPDNGAPIKALWFETKMYFTDKNFEVGEVINVEDDLGKYLIETYGFLSEVDEEEAKRLYAEQKNFKCDVCGAAFKVQIALSGHMQAHAKKNPAGIPTVEGLVPVQQKKIDDSFQASIENEAQKDGITGDGIVHESLEEAKI